jgi:glycosyltransferase involved in cell wall biosynthesis
MPFILLTLRQRFDVVHGHLYYYLRGLRAGVRIAHVHGDPLHKGMGAQVTGMTAKTFALLERTVDGFIAVSQFIADRLRYGLPDSDRIHVVYNGVNFDHFTMSDTDRAAKRADWREQWGAAPEDTVYVYVGAIVPEKGVLHLARAFATIDQERSDVHLVIVGSSSLWGTSKQSQDPNAVYEQNVREALEEAHARGHAHFTGKVPAPQVAALLAASDVFVMPSVWQEPCPLVILEAVASGLPLIASQNGGIPEIAACGHHWLIPAEEAALRDALDSAARGDLVYTPPSGLPTAPLTGKSPDAQLEILKTALAWERASDEVLDVYDAIRAKKTPKAARQQHSNS